MPEERSNGHVRNMGVHPQLVDDKRSSEPVDAWVQVTEWLANWTTTLREADLAAKTIRWYERDVTLFLAWMKDTVSLENALELIPMRLHPGAERYYREIGMAIPDPVTY